MPSTRTIHLPKGLYCFRVGGKSLKKCNISPAPGCGDNVEILFSPFKDRKSALGSGEAVAVRCLADAAVDLVYEAESGIEPLSFAFDRLDPLPPTGRAGSARLPEVSSSYPAKVQEAPRSAGSGLLLGHLARRGDVRVASGEWLGGAEAPMRIEGLAFSADAFSAENGLRYAVRTSDGKWSGAASAGDFVGSRGRAMPIVGLKVEFTDASAQLEIECLFLGARPVIKSGKRMEFSGPTGSEPLIGICARLSSSRPDGSSSSGAAMGPGRSRVKVFRKGEFVWVRN